MISLGKEKLTRKFGGKTFRRSAGLFVSKKTVKKVAEALRKEKGWKVRIAKAPKSYGRRWVYYYRK